MSSSIENRKTPAGRTAAAVAADNLPRLLIVDDDKDMLIMLRQVIQRKCNCKVELAESGEQALELFRQWQPDVILTDVKMQGLDGLALLRLVKEHDSTVSVILMTGHATVDLAVSALKEGAYDFFQKPFDNDLVIRAVQRTVERTLLLRENKRLQEKLAGRSPLPGFIGSSQRLREVYDLITKVANTDVTILIRGESGTGKELAAKTIHALSNRARKRMVTVNCPALPEHILESELFGYVRGAFTGATQDKKGLFLEASGSTLLLDEIGDIPIALQTKLLRVLQEKEIQPLGQTKNIKVDVRILASTNQNLEEKINEGLFREDLFYRLNVVTITMPSLRERQEDIPLLAQHFLENFAKEYQRQGLEFTPEALKHLLHYRWPGNVRQLQNRIKRAALLADDRLIRPEDLQWPEEEDPCQTITAVNTLAYNEAKQQVLEAFSKSYLANALRQKGGNVTAAAQVSGLGRQAFQRLLKKFGLQSSDYRSSEREGVDAT